MPAEDGHFFCPCVRGRSARAKTSRGRILPGEKAVSIQPCPLLIRSPRRSGQWCATTSANSAPGRLRLRWEERTFFFGRLETTPNLIKSRWPLPPSLSPSPRSLAQLHAVASPRLSCCSHTHIHNDCSQRHQRRLAQQGTSPICPWSPAPCLPFSSRAPSSSPPSLLVRATPTRSGMSLPRNPRPTFPPLRSHAICT